MSGEPRPTPRSPVDDARGFFRDNAWVFILGAGLTAMAYSVAIATFASSIDEAWHMLDDTTEDWVRQGRPMVPLMKFLLQDTFPMPHVSIVMALAARFLAAMLWAAFFAHAFGRHRVGSGGLLLFLVVFCTLPVIAYNLTYNTVNVEVSLGWLLAGSSAWLAWLAVVDRRGPWFGVAAMGSALMAVLTYQDLGFTIIAGVLIAQLGRLLTQRDGWGEPQRGYLRRTLLLSAPAAVALALGAATMYLLSARGGHLDGFVAWGTVEPALIMIRLGAVLLSYWMGLGFVGGWVLIPSVLAAGVLLVAIAPSALRARFWYPLELVVLIMLAPFALWFVLGASLPNRAIQALVLVAAGIWLLLDLVLPRRREVAVALVSGALLLAVWNTSINSRLFMTEKLTHETDQMIASQISERLAEAGWDGRPIPVVLAGSRAPGEVEAQVTDETFGQSAFVFTEPTSDFMRMLGYRLERPTPAQMDAGFIRSVSMPAWPAVGSVLLYDGIAIVKFDQPRPGP
jgi:MFS family permease